jgi:hypothetical protein
MGPQPHNIIGTIDDAGTIVKLYGKVPRSLIDCEVVTATEDTLEFDINSPLDAARNYGDDGRLFSSGNDDRAILSANVQNTRWIQPQTPRQAALP